MRVLYHDGLYGMVVCIRETLFWCLGCNCEVEPALGVLGVLEGVRSIGSAPKYGCPDVRATAPSFAFLWCREPLTTNRFGYTAITAVQAHLC
jgi:hypothetical protein